MSTNYQIDIKMWNYYANCLEHEQKDYSLKMIMTWLEQNKTINITNVRCGSGYDPHAII